MAEGHIAELASRTMVSVGGPEAEKFLNDLVTNDLAALAANGAGYGGLLTPQGKILFDFIVFRVAEQFLFELPKSVAAEFIKRLGFYKLRAKVEISDLSTSHRIAATWGNAGPPSIDGIVAADPRLPGLGYRVIIETDGPITVTGHAADNEAGYDAHRIALGIPEGGMDFSFGEAFPHDADMDQLGGVAFDKGCYVGQEVVSRMEHRGTARRRIVQVSADAPLPQPGAEISAGGRPVGTITSSADNAGLALIRLDRAKEAIDTGLPLLANNLAVEIKIPDWARFSWPDTVAQD